MILFLLYRCIHLKPRTQGRQSRNNDRHLGDENYPLLTKSTELNTFNFDNNVDHDTVDKVEGAGNSRILTNWQQIGDKSGTKSTVNFVDLSPVLATVDFVAQMSNVLSTLTPVCTGL